MWLSRQLRPLYVEGKSAPLRPNQRNTDHAISSELHRYRGHSKINMEPGYVCGHEGMGVVHEVGSEVKIFKKGDRVIAPFTISW